MFKIGRTKIPVFDIIAAIPKIVRKAQELVADNKAAASPGGAKVTAEEIAGDVMVFIGVLGQEILPIVVKANE